jgi:hypothetical protein
MDGMKTMTKRYCADFKANVALEAIRDDLTIAELGTGTTLAEVDFSIPLSRFP